jgi:transgelin
LKGLDAELEAKRMAQYDPKLEQDAKDYIKAKTGVNVGDFHADLKDGVALCNLMRTVAPAAGVGAPKGSKMPFVQMENIASYLAGCSKLGMKTHDLFQTVDLFEAKNLNQVVNNILQLQKLKP